MAHPRAHTEQAGAEGGHQHQVHARERQPARAPEILSVPGILSVAGGAVDYLGTFLDVPVLGGAALSHRGGREGKAEQEDKGKGKASHHESPIGFLVRHAT